MNDRARARALELLADRATGDLTPETRAELDALLLAHPEWDEDGFDLAVAALAAGVVDAEEPPAALRQRVLDEAAPYVTAPAAPDIRPRPRRDWSAWGGWLAAAVLAVALLTRLGPGDRAGDSAPDMVAALAEAPDATALPWTATEDRAATDASGEVVWSADRQQGYMRIRGLQGNDPTVSQYQLWIFDKERDERFPVDGGVFDVPPGEDEVVVPIRAAIEVGEATLFAVTVEKPGGVVVSDRERIVLVASPG